MLNRSKVSPEASVSSDATNACVASDGDGRGSPPGVDPRERIDGAATSESSTSQGLFNRHAAEIGEMLPRIAAALGLLGLGLYFIAYMYLLGFYEQFDVTMEEAGLDKAAILIRVAGAAVAVLGTSLITGLFLWKAITTRYAKQLALRTSQSRVAWWNTLGVAASCTVIALWLGLTSSPWFILLYLAATFVMLDLVVLNPFERLNISALVLEVKRLIPVSKLVRRAVVVAAVGATISAGLYLPSLAVREGVLDGHRALVNGPVIYEDTPLQFYTGARAQLVTLTWTGTGASPLSGQQHYALFLGANGGIAVLFDYNLCKTIRVPAASIVQQVYSKFYPPVSGGPPPLPSACVVR